MNKQEIEKRMKELEVLMQTLDCGDPRNLEVNAEYRRLKAQLQALP